LKAQSIDFEDSKSAQSRVGHQRGQGD